MSRFRERYEKIVDDAKLAHDAIENCTEHMGLAASREMALVALSNGIRELEGLVIDLLDEVDRLKSIVHEQTERN